MNNYDEKYNYLYRHQKGFCPICHNILTGIIEMHHKCHPSKWRRKKLPLFLNSLLNLVLLHKKCHTMRRSYAKISDYRADKYELFLQKHKKISNFVNMLLTP